MSIPYLKTLARFSLVTLIFMIFIVGAQPIAVNLFMPPLDKVVHSLTYGLLLLLAYFAFPKIKPIYLFLVVLSLGALDEIHQQYLIGRSPGLDDLLADFIGTSIAYLLIKVIDKRFKL
ncbi:MAG TPA: VanZ family protein [Methylotenera sp.]|nr:VanZ family protein [Methylotenera sp.]